MKEKKGRRGPGGARDPLRLDRQFGAHPARVKGKAGWRFRAWAPGAAEVRLMGDWNGWRTDGPALTPEGGGVYSGFVPGLEEGTRYKYAVYTKDGRVLAKADPFALAAEKRPGTASRLHRPGKYRWGDGDWMAYRRRAHIPAAPLNIYEVHLGSWRRTGEGTFLFYRDIAAWLVPYVKKMGFTHIELLPVTEHPLDASWGYQTTGYFAPTARFGPPEGLQYLIDQCHRAGIGVVLDWVPAHFGKDAFGLYEFDGGPCYEYADPRKGEHYGWGTRVFDYGKAMVRDFLISSALFWVEEYHADGLRVDAVSSMLYLDYGRQGGDWVPNDRGGRENWEAVAFLQQLNAAVRGRHPDVLMIAEESTAWPYVTGPTDRGETALGFTYKWNMGWMNDVLHYQCLDPIFRQHHHRDLTFSLMYAFSEAYILPLSHDEVVHGKGSLVGKMPGRNDGEKLAGARAFYLYMLGHPGKKLLMMGTEFGQFREWRQDVSLDWHLLALAPFVGQQDFFRRANALYRTRPPFWAADDSWEGFQWICPEDAPGNTVLFLRWDRRGAGLLFAVNFSPVYRRGYRVGAPRAGSYRVLLNTDDTAFGGGGRGSCGAVESEAIPCHGIDQSVLLDIPPLGGLLLECPGNEKM